MLARRAPALSPCTPPVTIAPRRKQVCTVPMNLRTPNETPHSGLFAIISRCGHPERTIASYEDPGYPRSRNASFLFRTRFSARGRTPCKYCYGSEPRFKIKLEYVHASKHRLDHRNKSVQTVQTLWGACCRPAAWRRVRVRRHQRHVDTRPAGYALKTRTFLGEFNFLW